jgi:hypothetical protein
MAGDEGFEAIAETMKRAAATLRDADVDYALAGSLATWARGGPETSHDLDFVVRERDSERAVAALEAAGMRREDPPEEWLVKAWDENGVLVDVIHGPSGVSGDEAIDRAETLEVLSMEMPVMALEDVIATKVMSLTEHRADYGKLLEMARALREQVDWSAVRSRTRTSPFADPFFVLLDRLGIVPDEAGLSGAGSGSPAAGGRVRVEVAGTPEAG